MGFNTNKAIVQLPIATPIPTPSGAALNNIIATPLTVDVDTSYIVIQDLVIASDFIVEGSVMVLDGAGTYPIGSSVATALVSASSIIEVATALAPTAGQVLTATSSTAASWATPSSGTGGYSGPIFSAYQSILQSLPTGTETKLLFQTEEFDSANCYSSSRFTPNVGGYYLITGSLAMAEYVPALSLLLSKNGVIIKVLCRLDSNTSTIVMVSGSAIVYLNGSTDYVELFGYQANGIGGVDTNAYMEDTYFQAVQVR